MTASWGEKYRAAKPARVTVLDKPFAGIPEGARLFIASPKVIDAYLRAIPAGRTKDVAAMRDALAKKNKAEATCPTSTAIFLRIVAESALERVAAGEAPAAVSPFWRVVEPGGALAQKLSCGPDFIAAQRALEAADRPAKPTRKKASPA
ncbi:hypothetical protein [Sediminicoccus rosea]|jgi:hypothetical protein|uniref:Uncharacterized protein n=1 Tax=Sediminicoccus rosea TaxID=1225128 RepID=A0ABZ0PF25_9PROT|nr:hypothetical protein [Sediminicoccus rosea]WPB84314.1 hypothetical protein R9Z33_19725 [Sediminicoccus rosea]